MNRVPCLVAVSLVAPGAAARRKIGWLSAVRVIGVSKATLAAWLACRKNP